MATSTQLIAIFNLFCFCFGDSVYSPWAKWILTLENAENGFFKDLSTFNNPPFSEAFSGAAITAGIGCSYFTADLSQFKYKGVVNSITSSLTEYGISAWMNIPLSSENEGNVLAIGETASQPKYSMKAKMGSDGAIYAWSGTPTNSITIPRNTWIFVVFYFTYTTKWNFDVFCPDFAFTTWQDSAYPGNIIMIGDSTNTLYYEIQAFKKAEMATTKVTLTDLNGVTYIATTPSCGDPCTNYCNPERGCLNTAVCVCPDLCTCGNDGACAMCSDTNAELVGGKCKCKGIYVLKGGKCVLPYPANCLAGSETVCTQCEKNYFLYDDSATTTICLGCDSCKTCNASPDCFECSKVVVQEGSSCREDSVGYQLSFDSPNIVMDFAHPMAKHYKLVKFSAATEAGDKVYASWSLSQSSTPSQYQIVTNLTDSQLPLELDFSFEETA